MDMVKIITKAAIVKANPTGTDPLGRLSAKEVSTIVGTMTTTTGVRGVMRTSTGTTTIIMKTMSTEIIILVMSQCCWRLVKLLRKWKTRRLLT